MLEQAGGNTLTTPKKHAYDCTTCGWRNVFRDEVPGLIKCADCGTIEYSDFYEHEEIE